MLRGSHDIASSRAQPRPEGSPPLCEGAVPDRRQEREEIEPCRTASWGMFASCGRSR